MPVVSNFQRINCMKYTNSCDLCNLGALLIQISLENIQLRERLQKLEKKHSKAEKKWTKYMKTNVHYEVPCGPGLVEKD